MTHLYLDVYSILGPLLLVLITMIGFRLLSYWRSILLHWRRYRQRQPMSTARLREIDEHGSADGRGVPFVKVQITTRGSAGSTDVVLRGIRNIERLVSEDPAFYGHLLSVEVVTESTTQARVVERLFEFSPLAVSVLVIPDEYETGSGTRFKARALHFAVVMRRAGWNDRGGRTFIVHFDEESVMVPAELRKLLGVLAATDKKVLEGPIYYPLDYMDASPICRAMEANRPVGCFECRHVMETGMPLHLHGSNLVVDEAFENELGWDIGCIDGQPFVAEDYMFGMAAFVGAGSDAFGWHGCVLLEQPPFSVRSAFTQRRRWIFGVLQGLQKWTSDDDFAALGWWSRARLVIGTRFRVACFAAGAVIGAMALLYLPYMLYRAYQTFFEHAPAFAPWYVDALIVTIALMWFGSIAIGAWYNLAESSFAHRWSQILLIVALAPLAGIVESTAGLWAVVQWNLGRRTVTWQPTPKTKQADDEIWKGRSAGARPRDDGVAVTADHIDGTLLTTPRTSTLKTLAFLGGSVAVVAVYLGIPLLLLVHSAVPELWIADIGAVLVMAAVLAWTLRILRATSSDPRESRRPAEEATGAGRIPGGRPVGRPVGAHPGRRASEPRQPVWSMATAGEGPESEVSVG